jgi:hypothetical protein
MVRSTLGALVVVFAALVLVSDATAGKDKKGGGSGGPNTVVWAWTTYDDSGKATMKGTWKVKGYVIFNGGGKRVGTYEDVGEGHVKVEIDEFRLTGTLDLRREAGSSQWSGELTRKSGDTLKIKVVFEK